QHPLWLQSRRVRPASVFLQALRAAGPVLAVTSRLASPRQIRMPVAAVEVRLVPASLVPVAEASFQGVVVEPAPH
ncbi:hypothetical protein, partial [Klebsiella variicola]|uniref:hypothetical protein n=1 Tax=Klebsiella variicola TaxID=244366 RepID=UPI0027300AB7